VQAAQQRVMLGEPPGQRHRQVGQLPRGAHPADRQVRSDNGLHYRRDVSLGEDASRIRAGQAPRLFATIGSTVIRVLNRAGHGNHAAARRDLAWDRTGLRALTLLGL
jgi:hypothetical protein